MSESIPDPPHSENQNNPIEPAEMIELLSTESFREWYRERKIRENIRNGQSYFNGPSKIPDPTRHSPSRLLQCHRKTVYRELNAPAEEADATGILWIGSQFEETVALPFLREAVTGAETYACNTLWIDFEVETDAGPIRIKGATDPAIVTRDGCPVLITEIKTKSSVEYIDVPDRHHRAQVHAYMYGLSNKYDRQITDAVIIYGSRETLDIEVFHVEFDPEFWTEVVIEWAETHSKYRLQNELPPAEPVFDWECEFCAYRHRCGEADTQYRDVRPAGFLPLFTYPKQKVVEYLQAHEEAKLTPTLACQFPELIDKHGVFKWRCVACGAEYEWDEPEWDLDPSEPPVCSECLNDGTPVPLKGPEPENQHVIDRKEVEKDQLTSSQ